MNSLISLGSSLAVFKLSGHWASAHSIYPAKSTLHDLESEPVPSSRVSLPEKLIILWKMWEVKKFRLKQGAATLGDRIAINHFCSSKRKEHRIYANLSSPCNQWQMWKTLQAAAKISRDISSQCPRDSKFCSLAKFQLLQEVTSNIRWLNSNNQLQQFQLDLDISCNKYSSTRISQILSLKEKLWGKESVTGIWNPLTIPLQYYNNIFRKFN